MFRQSATDMQHSHPRSGACDKAISTDCFAPLAMTASPDDFDPRGDHHRIAAGRGVADPQRSGHGGVVHPRRDADQGRRRRQVPGHHAGQVRPDRGAVPRRGEACLRPRGAALHNRGARDRRTRRLAGQRIGGRRGERDRRDPAQGRGQFHRHRAARDLRQRRRSAPRPRDPRRVRRERREAGGGAKASQTAPHPRPSPRRRGEGERRCLETPRPVYGEREGPAAQAWEGEGQPRAAVSPRLAAAELSGGKILWRAFRSWLRQVFLGKREAR